MPNVIQNQPGTATETTGMPNNSKPRILPMPKHTARQALIKSSTLLSTSSSIRSVGSLSELNIISAVNSFRISRHKKLLCCNISRQYQIRDEGKDELLFTACQDSACWTNDYEDLLVHDLHDQLMFSVEYEERTGYLSTQMKFSVVSSAKLGIGSVSRVCSFMDSPRYEILKWDGEHLFCIGPPETSGIPSYDYQRKYQVISNDGRAVATLVQQDRSVTLRFDEKEMLPIRDRTLILALAFILDLLRNEEI